jgi:hypothetical protein
LAAEKAVLFISWLGLGQQCVLFNNLEGAIHGPDFCEKVHIGL